MLSILGDRVERIISLSFSLSRFVRCVRFQSKLNGLLIVTGDDDVTFIMRLSMFQYLGECSMIAFGCCGEISMNRINAIRFERSFSFLKVNANTLLAVLS